MYRFRSIENLIGKHKELENQEIYFAAQEQLNDPMEGFLDIFWQGDKIVWNNLLKHYLMCLETVYFSNLFEIKKTTISLNDIPVYNHQNQYRTEKRKQMFDEIEKKFNSFQFIKKLPEYLSKKNEQTRRNELLCYLRSVHIYAVDSISFIYKNHSFLNPLFHKKKLKNLSDFSKANFELIKLINSFESNSIDELQFENITLSITNKTFHEYDLLIAKKNNNTNISNNFKFILYEFSEAYITRLESIAYPKWYTACFMSECSNSSVWGHYGDKHSGVCLKFKTNTIDNKIQLDLNTIYGCNEKGDITGMVPHTFNKVNYENKHVEIDFFKSLGRLPVYQLRYQWYTDQEGNMSSCADPINKDDEKNKVWLNKYWSNFQNGATTKLKDWEYENEYRLLINDMLNDYETTEKRKLKYDFNDLEGIIFGIKTSTSDKMKIIEIINQKCEKHNRIDFNFYQAYYSKETGNINYEKLNRIY